ncbi:MAG: pilus assembly protein [Burkholderiaceae bacterium]|nr:pilus assembly protein [Burkholderiaceae bacterium]
MINRLTFRWRAGVIHVALTALVALAAALLIFFLWYPSPYHKISGGLHLFAILLVVDLVLGPTLTLIVSNPNKPRRKLFFDWSVIVVLQLCALGYGLHTVALARPVVLAWEGDGGRFRLVSAASVLHEELSRAPPALQELSWYGPVLVSTRSPTTSNERFDAVASALAGHDLGTRPSFWLQWNSDAAKQASATPCDEPFIQERYEVEVACPPLLAKTGHWRAVLRQQDGAFLEVVAESSGAAK